MKIGQSLKKMVGGAMVLTALACPVFTSCYNDAALWDEIEGIHGDVATLEQKLAALEAKLNTDLQALKTLLEGQISNLEGKMDALVTVKDVKENTDGSVTVTLSDNTEFTVHPKFEQDYTGLVTTTTIDGVLYWAVFDENGKAVAVTDAEGDLVPVVDVVPQVRVDTETALVEISFDGGNTWIAVGYNEPCVFADAEVVYDQWGYSPTGLNLTLADGSMISVLVDGYGSIIFGDHLSGMYTTRFISYGETAEVIAMLDGVASWIKEVPAGWKVEENADEVESSGQLLFNVTAPTKEAIESGAAVAEGKLKLLAVLNGGKSITASVILTTSAFANMSAGQGVVSIEKNAGITAFFYGLVPAAEFDAEAIESEFKVMAENDPYFMYSYEGNMAYYSIENVAFEDMGADLVYGENYVLYALGFSQVEDADYNVTTTFAPISYLEYTHFDIVLDEEKTVATFSSIDVAVEFKGLETYHAYLSPYDAEEGYDLEYDVQSLNLYKQYGYAQGAVYFVNDESVEGWNNGVFTGNLSDLAGSTEQFAPGTNYYLWITPAGKDKYTVDDLYVYEFATKALVAGSSISVVPGDPNATYTSITVPLTAENAWGIYYAWVAPEKVSTIADKTAYLMSTDYSNSVVRTMGSSVTARSNSNYYLSLKANSSAVLLALAIDENGAYGDVFEKEFNTKSLEYNDVTFDLKIDGDVTDKASVSVSVSGGEPTEYYYMYCKADDYKWTSTFGGSEESASEYFATTTYKYNFTTLNALPENGLIELKNIEYGEYVFVISSSSTDENGEKVYSKAKVLEFKRELNFGTIVSAKDDNGNDNAEWVAAKPVVDYTLDSVGDDSSVNWTVSDLPEGWTGFTAVIDSEYTATLASDKDLITFLVLNEYGWAAKFDLVNGETYSKHWLYTANYDLYVVLVDPEGNYYAPYKWNFDATAGGFGI